MTLLLKDCASCGAEKSSLDVREYSSAPQATINASGARLAAHAHRAVRQCGKIGASKHRRQSKTNKPRRQEASTAKNIRVGSAMAEDMSKKRTPCCSDPKLATSVSTKNQPTK